MTTLTPMRSIVLSVAFLAAGAVVLQAHDFWLVPNAFEVAAGGTIDVLGQTSSDFPTSESAVTTDRVADARVIGANKTWKVDELGQRGKSLLVRHRPSDAGQYAVVVGLHPRTVRESAASFRRYLELEGAPDALARVDREGLLAGRDSLTRRYAKYAKTLVQVGNGGAPAFDKRAGHVIEFIPLRNPATLRAGDTLRARLLYEGQPLANTAIHAGAVAWSAGSSLEKSPATSPDVKLFTNAEGIVAVPILGGGLWNLRTIHITQARPNSGADWDAHWATLVFHVRGIASSKDAMPSAADSRREVQSDSAIVAGVVDAYHRALRTGDSTAALALLTDDVVILESGGLETRDEYRSHHLPGDIGFAQAIASQRGPIRVTVRGGVAWASSTSTTTGDYRGRAINSAGAELMVLTRAAGGWKISAIHWSSRTRR